jgi:hypothetical protein
MVGTLTSLSFSLLSLVCILAWIYVFYPKCKSLNPLDLHLELHKSLSKRIVNFRHFVFETGLFSMRHVVEFL